MLFNKNKKAISRGPIKYRYNIKSGLKSYSFATYESYGDFLKEYRKAKKNDSILKMKDVETREFFAEFAVDLSITLVSIESNMFSFAIEKELA